MEVTANNTPCIAGEIIEQPTGAWTARIELDTEKKIDESITIKVGTESFVGTVVRGDVPTGRGRWVGYVVGGAGGLDVSLGAKYYVNTPLRTVLQDALAEAGEALSSADTDTTKLGSPQQRWQRSKDTTRAALNAIAKSIGGFWRVSRSGQVAMRLAETWAPVSFAYEYIDADPSDGEISIAPLETPAAKPGVKVGDYKCAVVTTSWSGAGVRQTILLDKDDGRPRGAGGAFADNVKRVTDGPINYSQWYPAKIVQQDADGTLHLLPDDARVRGTGMTKVPLRTGIPGLTVKVLPGTYVRVFFENGSPAAPVAALMDHASGVLEVQLQTTVKCAVASPQLLLGPTTSPTQSMLQGELEHAWIDGIVQALSNALALITPGPASSGGAPAKAAFDIAVQALAAAKQAALSPTTKVG